MKFRPILFSTAMVQANHDGRKNQTRRLNGLEMFNKSPDNWCFYVDAKGQLQYQHEFDGETCGQIDCPYGQVGDVLWVRETVLMSEGKYYYRTDDKRLYAKNSGAATSPWKPSIHMPAAACRSWCMITGIELQRLHDITEWDAVNEGIEQVPSDMPITWRNYEEGFEWDGLGDATQSFETLWISINGKESWEANPWVWVVRYEHTTTPPAGWEEYLLLVEINNLKKHINKDLKPNTPEFKSAVKRLEELTNAAKGRAK